MDVTKPYKFIGFGAMDVTKPYEFIGFGPLYGSLVVANYRMLCTYARQMTKP